jgi:hypothetical protein
LHIEKLNVMKLSEMDIRSSDFSFWCLSKTKGTGILQLYCDYVLLLLSPVENVEALVYWSSENVTYYHLVHILSWPVLIFVIYYCVHSLRIESFRVSVHNRKHLSELNVITLRTCQSHAVTYKCCQILTWAWEVRKESYCHWNSSCQFACSLENIIIKISCKIDDNSS